MPSHDPRQPYPLSRSQPVRIPVRRPDRPDSESQTDDLNPPVELTWQQRYARLQADLENAKRRSEQRHALEYQQQRSSLLRDMLPLADNLEAALAHSRAADPATAALREGVELTLRAFLDTLHGHGVSPISAAGEPFDPTLHEAVGLIDAANAPAGNVVQVLQTGYTVDGALLRPARVLIAR